MVGHRRACDLGHSADDLPHDACHREREPTAESRRLERRDRAAADDVDVAIGAGEQRGDHCARRVVVVDHRERRVRDERDRHDREAQPAPERARDVRAHHRCEAQAGHGGAGPPRGRGGSMLDVEQGAPER